ncbi:MAG: DUF4920 domain-containing protein [Vicingaceae bacterium]
MKTIVISLSIILGLSASLFGQSEVQYFGALIDDQGALTPEEFLKSMDGKEEMNAKLEAKIVTCCKKKGCWMDLDLENGTTMKVRFKDYEFFVPKDADGKMAVIEGVAKIETIDVETLRHYAEDAGKGEKEIAAITEPERSVSFEAAGVIIK